MGPASFVTRGLLSLIAAIGKNPGRFGAVTATTIHVIEGGDITTALPPEAAEGEGARPGNVRLTVAGFPRQGLSFLAEEYN